MGFFATQPKQRTGLPSKELMHRLECKICPLNKVVGNENPHMEPTGSKRPVVYMLGEAPGADEDAQNEQFVGESGQLLRARVPKQWLGKLRWNNVVRTRPFKNETPMELAIECCRPSIERDIAASKPKAIFGFGNVPLNWAISTNVGIGDWRGRRIPVSIGGHECWYYPMIHPAYLVRIKKGNQKPAYIGSEEERAFVFDLKRAFDEIEGLPLAEVHTEETVRHGMEIITGEPGDLMRLIKLLNWAKKQPVVGVDYETNCIRPYKEGSKILTAAVGTEEISFAFAVDHRQARWSKAEAGRVKALWKDFLKSRVRKAVHFLTFELEWLGVKFGKEYLRAARWDDTATQAAVLDERRGRKDKRQKGGPLSLDFLVQQSFGFNLKAMADLDKSKLDEEPLEEVLWYNAGDAKYHCLLYLAQDVRIKAEGLEDQYEQSLRRVSTCVLTQMQGLHIDKEETARLDKKYTQSIQQSSRKIANSKEAKLFLKRYKREFDPASNKECAIMFRDLLEREEGWTEDKYSGERKYSVDKDTLNKIDIPLSRWMINLREIQLRKSTFLYGDTWPDGLIHAIFNTVFTTTGRLSSDSPNLQNIPKRDNEAKEVRRQIIAPPGHCIIAADYGQIEARVIAMLSKDKNFVKALWDRFDVHGHWAMKIASSYPERIGGKQFLQDKKAMKDFRTDIKNQWTFPLFFGAQLESVAGYLSMPVEELAGHHKDFQAMFPGVFKWQEQLTGFYHENGYVETPMKRRRRAPLSHNELINSPVQGGAAEIVMDGMSRLSEFANRTEDWYFQPIMNVHDELVFIVPEDKADRYIEKIVKEMIRTDHLKFANVPITIEMSMGNHNFLTYDAENNPDGMREILVASSDMKEFDWKI